MPIPVFTEQDWLDLIALRDEVPALRLEVEELTANAAEDGRMIDELSAAAAGLRDTISGLNLEVAALTQQRNTATARVAVLEKFRATIQKMYDEKSTTRAKLKAALLAAPPPPG